MTPADRPPTSRQIKRADSDHRILSAARHLFAELGFDQCTVRAIADHADVDPALVVRRFGGKDQLFLLVVQTSWSLDDLTAPPDAGGDLVARWLTAYMTNVDQGTELHAITSLLRSALVRPETAELMRTQLFEEAAGRVLAEAVHGPHAAERAQIAAGALLGVTLARRILGAEPLASLDGERLDTYLETMLRALLGPDTEQPHP
jgi:AcrR family transcriptional regulator